MSYTRGSSFQGLQIQLQDLVEKITFQCHLEVDLHKYAPLSEPYVLPNAPAPATEAWIGYPHATTIRKQIPTTTFSIYPTDFTSLSLSSSRYNILTAISSISNAQNNNKCNQIVP
jgi:hypothetical protein